MKKQLQIKKGEPLHKWIDRIADYWNFGEELKEMLSKVSKESYIQGSNDTIKRFNIFNLINYNNIWYMPMFFVSLQHVR